MTTQKEYRFNDLVVTKTRIEGKSGIIKFIDVCRDCGDYYLTLDETDTDYSKAIILSINEDNKNDSII